MGIKILQKQRVIVSTGGGNKAVLCRDLGVIYLYDDPSVILAVYDENRRAWIVADKPYYSTGGWGSGSHGDREGFYNAENAREILRAIDGRIIEVNLPSLNLLGLGDFKKFCQDVSKIKAIKQAGNKLGMQLELDNFETKGLKFQTKNEGTTSKGLDVFKVIDQYSAAVGVFKNGKGKPVKVGNYTVRPNLVTQTTGVSKEIMTVAFRDSSGHVFMNSQVLQLESIERYFLGKQSIIQSEIRKIAKFSIPFNVLDAAKLKLNETTVLEQGPEQDFEIRERNDHGSDTGKLETRHFTGALLLENAGRKFLMDLDRIEIEHKIFNVFFVELKSHVKTISEAYESMKPTEVRDAEKRGIEVKRQGEWFFIKTDKTLVAFPGAFERYMPRNLEKWNEENKNRPFLAPFKISHGQGRPNTLLKPVNYGDGIDELVCGVVTHDGREHQPLDLGAVEPVFEPKLDSEGNNILDENGDLILSDKVSKYVSAETDRFGNDWTASKAPLTVQLWKVVPNETIGNFTIQGDVD